MSGGEVALVVALTVTAMIGGACLVMLLVVTRTLRELQRSIAEFEADSDALLDDLRTSARHAAAQVDRVDRLVTAAETVEARRDSAARLAQRTFRSPVVKALAIREGVNRASWRLKVGSDTGRRRASRRVARSTRKAS